MTAKRNSQRASAGRLRWATLLLIAGSLVAIHWDAHAGLGTVGVNLSWDNCGAYGTLNKDFSCATNSATFVLVPSAVVVELSPTLMDSNIELIFDQSPSWWAFQSSGCRAGALASTPGVGGLTGCLDYFGSRPSSSIAGWQVLTIVGNPIGYKLRLVTWTDPQHATLVPDGTEIYGGRIVIDTRKTVGADSCLGCSLKGTFIFGNVTVESLEFPSGWSTSREATRNYVFWQNSLVPTLRPTWGSIKAMYR
ncbi:MAG: hypothetical protein ABIS67_13565 [Candidatus Eisenbacteria bacterium]